MIHFPSTEKENETHMQKIIKGSKPKMYEITKQNSFFKKSEQQL
jgi:hypothetical protein